MEKKNTAKLIRHNQKMMRWLIDIILYVAVGMAAGIAFLIVVLIYCRMAGPLI